MGKLLILPLCGFLVLPCAFAKKTDSNVVLYGKLQNGQEVYQYTLRKGNMTVKAINYGGIITDILVPDRDGKIGNVVLGYDELLDYETKNRFFGAIVGRYANRIRNAKASINGRDVTLAANKGQHQIHGGNKGFDKVLWQGELSTTDDYSRLTLTYFSADGEEGYPGNLKTTVTYTLDKQQALRIDYLATTDRPTVVNLTQHSYFNLQPETHNDVLSHQLKINSDEYLPIDPLGFPESKAATVDNSPFDFTKFKTIHSAVSQSHKQLTLAKGIDHYWVRKSSLPVPELVEMAQLKDRKSGRKLTVSSTSRGLQIYAANYLNDSVIGRGKQKYKIHQGICLETGEFPNSPADPSFPNSEISVARPFKSTTIFQFSTQNYAER